MFKIHFPYNLKTDKTADKTADKKTSRKKTLFTKVRFSNILKFLRRPFLELQSIQSIHTKSLFIYTKSNTTTAYIDIVFTFNCFIICS